MTTRVSITYDTNQSSCALSSYRLNISPSGEAVTGRLEQDGAVYNGLVSYSGVFGSERDAVQATLEYITAPGYRIVKRPDQTHALVATKHKPGPDSVTVGTRFPNGAIFLT